MRSRIWTSRDSLDPQAPSPRCKINLSGEGAHICENGSHEISHGGICARGGSVEIIGEQSMILYPIIQRRQLVPSIMPGRRYDTVAFAVPMRAR